MKFSAFIAISLLTIMPLSVAIAQESESAWEGGTGFFESITFEGGPIWSKHFQFGDQNFREHHGLAALKVSTRDYGNWGVYYLSKNSVRKNSVGVGYVTDPWVIPLGGSSALEFNGILGLVTGYQDYPVPLLAVQARIQLYETGRWNFGIASVAAPYYAEDPVNGDDEFGIVATTPFLSARYRF